MSANVISHRQPHRKRGRAWSWTRRRLGLLIVTAAALLTATWLAAGPRLPASSPRGHSLQTAEPAPPPSAPARAIVDVSADTAAAVAPQRTRAATRRSGVSLDARTDAELPGYEILSAAELAAISQARD
jgi:hypothetical protein